MKNSWLILWFRTHRERAPHLPTVLNEDDSFIKKQGFKNLKVVIDIGADIDLSSTPFAKTGFFTILVNISANELQLQRSFSTGLQRHVDFLLADAFHLPIRDRSVDLALIWGLLEHFEPRDSVRIVKEKLLISMSLMEIIPHRRCVGYLLVKKLAKLLGRRWPNSDEVERDYDEREILKEMSIAGCRVKCLEKFGRRFGAGFLIPLNTSDPQSHRKALSGRPLLEKMAFIFYKFVCTLLKSYDNQIVIGDGLA